jgi:amino acid transporter
MTHDSSGSSNQPEASKTAAPEELERHSLGLPAVIAQSAALTGPAVGIVTGLTFMVSFSGGATPLAFLIGFIAVLCIAAVIGEYAKRLPSAGSFYTYLSNTFGPKSGFVAGVLLFGAYVLLFPFQLDFLGNFISSWLASGGVHISWVVFAVIIITFSTSLGILGIKPSLRTGLIGLAFEMTVLIIFAIVIVVHGGAAGNTFRAFSPSASLKGMSGLSLAVVYTLFAFVGFESATTLGDEAKAPRKTIPRATFLTTFIIGAFYIFVSYAVTIGYGLSPKHVNALVTAAAPFNTLADHYGNGVLSVFVNIAVISSFTALNMVTVIAVSRILWKMGRDRLLPGALARVNKRQSPWVACLVEGIFAITVSIGFGLAYGPVTFSSWLGFIATLFFIGAYVMICVGVVWFIWTKYRSEFNWFLHGVLPFISLVAMIWVLYGNVHPLPPSPLRWFIVVAAGVVLGSIALVHWLARRNPEVMLRAGQVLGDIEEEMETAPEGLPLQTSGETSTTSGD